MGVVERPEVGLEPDDAPADRTTGPGTRVVRRLAEVWEGAWVAGSLRLPDDPVSPRLSRDLARIGDEMGLTAPEAVFARGMLAWAALFGCITFEVFGQYGPDAFTRPEDIFEHHLDALVEAVGLG